MSHRLSLTLVSACLLISTSCVLPTKTPVKPAGDPALLNPGLASKDTGKVKGVVTSGGVNFAVQQAGDSPVADAIVYLDEAPHIATKTDASGRFELAGVPTGEHYIIAHKNTKDGEFKVRVKTNLAAANEVADIKSMVLRRTGSINGTVKLEDGGGRLGADVFIGGSSMISKAKENGAFGLIGIAEGAYNVTASVPGYEPQTLMVEVKAGKPSAIDFTLKRQDPREALANISGEVAVLTSVGVVPVEGVIVSIQGGSISSVTDTKGRYTLTNVPNGLHVLQFFRAGFKVQTLTRRVDFAPTVVNKDLTSPKVTLERDLQSIFVADPVAAAVPKAVSGPFAALPDPEPDPALRPSPPPAVVVSTPPTVDSPVPSPSSGTVSASPVPSASATVVASPTPKPSTLPTPSPTPTPNLALGNSLSGIIRTNTSLTKANSPYKLTGLLQIANGATLTVEPGVTINGGSEIEVFGSLKVAGTSSERATLNSVAIRPGSNSSRSINIEYANLNSCNIGRGFAQQHITIRNSRVDKSSIFLHQPLAECLIEKNIFTGSPSVIEIWTYQTYAINIINNVFDSTNSGIDIRYSSYQDKCNINYNSFLGTSKQMVKLVAEGTHPGVLNGINNYWGTTDKTVIEGMIKDNFDDLNLSSAFPFEPYLSAPHANTPLP